MKMACLLCCCESSKSKLVCEEFFSLNVLITRNVYKENISTFIYKKRVKTCLLRQLTS